MILFKRCLANSLFSVSLLVSLFTLTTVYAENTASTPLYDAPLEQMPFTMQENEPNFCCTPPYEPDYHFGCGNIYLERVQGDGVGYRQGYSTLGVFFSLPSIDLSPRFFFDARAHTFNTKKYAYNIGTGVRFWNNWLKKIIGLNAYYDSREAGMTYKQAGLGLEILGCRFGVRFNGYLPLGKRNCFALKDKTSYSMGRTGRQYKRHYSLGGFDGEVETSLCRWKNYPYDPYFAAGGYYFQGKNIHLSTIATTNPRVAGGKMRAGICYGNFLKIEVRATFDNVYHTNVQGVIAFNCPLGGDCQPSPSCNTYTPCYDMCRPVVRNEIIVLNKECFWHITAPYCQ